MAVKKRPVEGCRNGLWRVDSVGESKRGGEECPDIVHRSVYIFTGATRRRSCKEEGLLGGFLLWSAMGQAVDVGCDQLHFVVAQQFVLRGHMALATMANGLLQLGQAGAVNKGCRCRQVRRAQ